MRKKLIALFLLLCVLTVVVGCADREGVDKEDDDVGAQEVEEYDPVLANQLTEDLESIGW